MNIAGQPPPHSPAGDGVDYPVPPPGAGEGRHLLDYARVLYKQRRVAFGVLALVVAVVGWITFRAEPIYEARVQLQIEPENRNIVLFKEVIEQDAADKDYQQTQHRILESRRLARRTIDKLQLWEHPELRAGEVRTEEAQPATGFFARLKRIVTRPFQPPVAAPKTPTEQAEEDAALETSVQARTIDAFLQRLDVEPVRNSRLVDVKLRSRDPVLAASMANSLAQNFIDQTMETKLGASKQASDWLSEQLESQRKQVEESEVALQRYRERNDALALEEPNNIVLQKLTDLNSAVTRAKTERIDKEVEFRQAQGSRGDAAALNSVPAIISNGAIQQLRAEISNLQREQMQQGQRLGELHPTMIQLRSTLQLAEQRLAAEVDRVVLSLSSDYQSALETERRLVGALETQKGEALALNRKGIDYGALQREATSNRQIFETLLQRARETGISGELRNNNISIVDAADQPRAPVWPPKRRNLLLSLLGGAVMAILTAFFVDYLDNRIKSPDEIRSELGLPLIGLVPYAAAKNHGGKFPLINNGVPAKFSEAVRAVRTNVLLTAGNRGRSLVVTSTAPTEGKTVVATNLAMALAQAGQRVVLVDADLRRPKVHTVFEVPQAPGLAELLAGKTSVGEAFKETSVSGLYLLPAGIATVNPADVLGAPVFAECLRTMARHFDWVVIDSPPVLAVTDAALVAHLASAVLFVVGADKTSRHAARAALEQLEAARATFLGGVLNGVDLDGNPYYFAKYYRKEYGTYYGDSPAA